MARSRQSFSASSFARGGMALALAATLAVGSVPATALVQSQLDLGAPVAMAAEGDEYDLEVGDTFTVTASYSAAGNTADKNMDAIVQGMVGGCLGAGVTGKVLDDGSYQLTIPRLETASDAIQAISFNSVSVSPENGGYTFTVESLDETILANAVINNPTMAGMFPNGVDFAINLDTSRLPIIVPDPDEGDGSSGDEGAVDPIQTQTVSYFVKDSGNSFSGLLPSSVQVAESQSGGYEVTIPVSASTIKMVNDTFWMKDANGAEISPNKDTADGSCEYVLSVDDVAGAAEFSFGYTVGPMSNTHNMIMRFFDCTAINAALSAAKAISDDGSEAYAAFAKVQEQVKSVVTNAAATADELNAAASELNAAVAAYNEAVGGSGDAEDPSGDGQTGDEGQTGSEGGDGDQTSEADEVETPDGFLMVAGQTYTLPVSYLRVDTGEESMAASFMEDTAAVVYEDGAYTVTIAPTAQGAQYLTGIGCDGATVTKLDDGSFAISGLKSIAQNITLQAGMPGGSQLMLMQLDTSSLKTASGDPIVPEDPEATDPSGNNNQNNNGGGASTPTQTARFAVGHTYQVPIAIMKQNSSETSMAAQYFGSSAYVRPLDNGTMEVSFSTNRTDYISGLTYQGAVVPQSGATFTLTIPYTESDTVLPLGMTIVPMQELGMGTVTADMHLYLSQATDLGSGVTSAPSSAATMAKTGDDAPVAGVVGVAALAAAGVAAAGAAGMARRRQN